MYNSLNPASYTYTVSAKKQPGYYQYRVVQSNDVSTPLNKRQANGRINASGVYGDFYVAITVSPLHPSFHSQIENGIKDMVYALLDKNYLTISSCEGHGDSSPYVKIAFSSVQDAESIISYFSDIPNVTCRLSEHSANVEMYKEYGVSKIRPLGDSKFDKDAETDSINKLFFRSHTSYCFLDIIFYDSKPEWWNIIGLLRMKRHKKKNLNSIKQQIVDIIKDKQFPVYIK